jgi:hypothetical protein
VGVHVSTAEELVTKLGAARYNRMGESTTRLLTFYTIDGVVRGVVDPHDMLIICTRSREVLMRVVPASTNRAASATRRKLQQHVGINDRKEFTKFKHEESDKCLQQLLKFGLLPECVVKWMATTGYPEVPFVTGANSQLSCDMSRLGVMLGMGV